METVMKDFHDEMRRRKAIMPVGGQLMDRIFRLPEGYEVERVGVLDELDAFGVVVKSAAFEPIPPGVMLPRMRINYRTCSQCGGAELVEVVYPADPLQSMNVHIP